LQLALASNTTANQFTLSVKLPTHKDKNEVKTKAAKISSSDEEETKELPGKGRQNKKDKIPRKAFKKLIFNELEKQVHQCFVRLNDGEEVEVVDVHDGAAAGQESNEHGGPLAKGLVNEFMTAFTGRGKRGGRGRGGRGGHASEAGERGAHAGRGGRGGRGARGGRFGPEDAPEVPQELANLVKAFVNQMNDSSAEGTASLKENLTKIQQHFVKEGKQG